MCAGRFYRRANRSPGFRSKLKRSARTEPSISTSAPFRGLNQNHTGRAVLLTLCFFASRDAFSTAWGRRSVFVVCLAPGRPPKTMVCPTEQRSRAVLQRGADDRFSSSALPRADNQERQSGLLVFRAKPRGATNTAKR